MPFLCVENDGIGERKARKEGTLPRACGIIHNFVFREFHMAKIAPLSKEAHASKRWIRDAGHAWAAADTVVPLVAFEMPKALLIYPLAFIRSPDDGYLPVAVLGLGGAKNLFVAPDGRWIGGYKPLVYQAHPFVMATDGQGQPIVCVKEDSELLSDTSGDALFEGGGQPSAVLKSVMEFLGAIAGNRPATLRACQALQANGLIKPWQVTLKDDGGERPVAGLYCVDEDALNALSAENFESLRQAGALVVAYCQLLSMQQLPVLGKLARAHGLAAKERQEMKITKPAPELNLEFLKNNDTIKFS